jgi:hypothetical protein
MSAKYTSQHVALAIIIIDNAQISVENTIEEKTRDAADVFCNAVNFTTDSQKDKIYEEIAAQLTQTGSVNWSKMPHLGDIVTSKLNKSNFGEAIVKIIDNAARAKMSEAEKAKIKPDVVLAKQVSQSELDKCLGSTLPRS